MEIENRRRDRIYSFADLYENIVEIMEKDLTFIIYGNKFLHTYQIGEEPVIENTDFICKLWGWHHNGLVFKNTGTEKLMLTIYKINDKLYTCGYKNSKDTSIEIADIFEVYRPYRD